MQGTLEELRNIAVSQDIKERLMMAVCKVAVEVYVDPASTAEQKNYAVSWGKSPRSIAEQMTPLVVTLAADNTDAKLIEAVHTVFDVYASILVSEPV
jgi:hypothetical protein